MTFANFSRCIPVNFVRGKYDLEDFKYHKEAELAKLSSFLPLILFYREQVIDIYKQQYEIMQGLCEHSRICHNIAIATTI